MGRKSGPKNDLIGKQFGLLTVIEYAGNGFWLCQCSCPDKNYKTCRTCSLNNGHNISCGCIGQIRHGLTGTPEYRAWKAIKNRCYNPEFKDFKYYGGKGIVVSDEWKDDPEQFYKDMGKRPSEKHSIDRIDSNGNYCKENCRWATPIEQANNTSWNLLVEYNGEVHTAAEWDRIQNFPKGLIARRLRDGWSIEKALTIKPIEMKNKRITEEITFNGKTQTVCKFANEYSLKPTLVADRLKLGWSIEKALTTPPAKSYIRKKNNGKS